MPTLPLHDVNASPLGWHAVRSPGGYEWWYFDAEDVERDLQVVMIVLEGHIFHPGYLRAYDRWHRRPTRYAPPVPGDFCCAYCAVYRGGRVLHQSLTQFPSGSLQASSTDEQLDLGPNRIATKHGAIQVNVSGTPWVPTWRGPVLQPTSLQTQMTFTPRAKWATHERSFLSERMTGAMHRWIITAPLCDVHGRISCNGQMLDFNGRGYHDHNYGTAPIGPGLRRWFWGRILLEDVAYSFHFAEPKNPSIPLETHLLKADLGAMQELPTKQVEIDWSGRTGWRLDYPKMVRVDDLLTLSRPRVIDYSPFYLRMIYPAVVEGRNGLAFCELAYPDRLRWPILGRMIECGINGR